MGTPQGTRGVQTGDRSYRKDYVNANAGVSGLLLPFHYSRCMFNIQNNSPNTVWLEFGSARAKATISGGMVTGVTVVNGGFGFTKAPAIEFLGGGQAGVYGPAPGGSGEPGYAAPSNRRNLAGRPAQAIAIMGAAGNGVGLGVASITVLDPGADYAFAPTVFFTNDPADPFGVADPYYGGNAGGTGGVNSGMQLPSGSSYYESSIMATEQISIWSSAAITQGQIFCRWMI